MSKRLVQRVCQTGDLRFRRYETPNLTSMHNLSDKPVRIKTDYRQPVIALVLESQHDMMFDYAWRCPVYISGEYFTTMQIEEIE